MLVRLISRFLPMPLKKQLKNFRILSVQYGQYQTIKRWECVNREGDKIPWYTYPAIEFLNNLDFSQKTVFEYGSGNSSAFWARRSKTVLSIEHDRNWYEKIKSGLASNQAIHLLEHETDYVEAIIKGSSTSNAVFGFKVMDWYLDDFLARLRQTGAFGRADISDLALLRNAFPRLRFDLIVRRHKLRQAISKHAPCRPVYGSFSRARARPRQLSLTGLLSIAASRKRKREKASGVHFFTASGLNHSASNTRNLPKLRRNNPRRFRFSPYRFSRPDKTGPAGHDSTER